MKIKSFSLTIPANRSFSDFGWKVGATIVIGAPAIENIKKLALEKVREKYPEALNPTLCAVHLSRRGHEGTMNAACEVNIGDGDYVTRHVKIDLPLIEWGLV